MPFYEHIFIARPEISAAQVEAITNDMTEVLKTGGAKVTKTEYWGLKSLAYKIKKSRKAHYVLLNVDGPHPALAEVERLERLHEDVLRFMTVRVDELEEEPSVMMRPKSEKKRHDDRGGRPHRGGDRGSRPPRSGGGGGPRRGES